MRSIVDLFLEKIPNGIDIDEIKGHLLELNGVKDGVWDLNTIFEFNAELITEDGQVHGSYVQNKGMPKCIGKIVASGINDLVDIFKPNKK